MGRRPRRGRLSGNRRAPRGVWGGVTTLRWIAALIAAAAVGASLPPAPASSPAPACHSVVHHGVLPTWARTGFSDPRPRLPHVLGRSGEIAALVFGYPLRSPPLKDRGNKILWVSRRAVKPLSDLRIHAQRMDGPPSRRAPGHARRGRAARAVGDRPPGARLLAADAALVGAHRRARPALRQALSDGDLRDQLVELPAQARRQARGEGELERDGVVAQLAVADRVLGEPARGAAWRSCRPGRRRPPASRPRRCGLRRSRLRCA